MSRKQRGTAALFVTAIAAVVLSLIAVSGALVPGEVGFAGAVQTAPGGGGLDAIGDFLASSPVEVGALVAGLLIALARRDVPLAVSAVLVLAAIGINPELKVLIGRARPTAADVRVSEFPGGMGFPSGHTLTATLLYGYVAVVAWRALPRPAALAATVAAACAVGAIGFERVYAGAHWPSDVGGGSTIGVLLLAAAVALPRGIAEAVRRASRRRT